MKPYLLNVAPFTLLVRMDIPLMPDYIPYPHFPRLSWLTLLILMDLAGHTPNHHEPVGVAFRHRGANSEICPSRGKRIEICQPPDPGSGYSVYVWLGSGDCSPGSRAGNWNFGGI